MTANKDLGRRLSDLYEAEATPRAPEWLLEQALEIIDTTRQRRVVIRVPWGLPTINGFTKVAIAAVVVVAVGAIGLAVFRPASSQVGGPQVSPSPSPSVRPSPSPSTSPELTETFTSAIHGMSVSHPIGWMVQRATALWKGDIVQLGSASADIICSWGGQPIPARATCDESPVNMFVALASEPLGGISGDEWIADYMGRDATCSDATEPATIDGIAGVISPHCYDGRAALVTVDDRGYLIWLYGSDDVGWFKDIVATVKLHPEDATEFGAIGLSLNGPSGAVASETATDSRSPDWRKTHMSTRRIRLLPGLMVALGAIAAGCSSAASLAPSPQPSPSSAPPSVVAVASPNASSTAPPALTETFTSKMHGISAAYPAGWTARAASEPWTTAEWNFEDPRLDIVHDPSLADHLFLALGSMPLGATSADKWIADRLAVNECSAAEPVTVDGAAGSLCAESGAGAVALVSTGGRGYMIDLYTSGDEAWLDSVYDRAWFMDVLAKVDLRPEDAVDVVPSPSP